MSERAGLTVADQNGTARDTDGRVDVVDDGCDWLADQPEAAMVYLDPPYGHGTFGHVEVEWVERLVAAAWERCSGIVYLHGDPQLLLAMTHTPEPRGTIAWANGWVSGFKSRSTRFWPRQYQLVVGYARPDWRLRPVARPASEFKGTARRPTPSASFVYSDWWTTPNPVDQMSFSKEKVGWPTQKPVELLSRLILGSTDEGDLVLDPTCGSGTSLVAAQALGRRWLGADRDPAAVAIARERLAA